MDPLADPGGGAAGTRPPQQDPFLSFSPKSVCVGGWRPPPPTGNPGSATGISFGLNSRGPGYWKFTTSLLDNKEFSQQLEQQIQIEAAQQYESASTKWEIIKLAIRTIH